MKVVAMIARYLLGLVFFVFGLNGYLHFIPMHPPPPTSLAGQFMGSMFQSHFVMAVFAVEVFGGLLLLAGRYVRLGLLLLGPLIVCIILYHGCMDTHGLPMALIVGVLWLLVFLHDKAFKSEIFMAKVPE